MRAQDAGGLTAYERLRRHAGTVLTLLVIWLVGLAVLAAVFALHEREDAAEHAPVVVANLSKQVGEVSGLPFEAAPGHDSTPRQIRARIVGNQRLFQELVGELAGVHSVRSTSGLARLGRQYFGTIRRALALVSRGKIEEAGFVVGEADRRGGVTWRLRQEFAAQNAAVAHEGHQARTFANVGITLVVVVALIAFSLAVCRTNRSRRRSEGLAGLNERLLELSRHDAERYRDLFENANEPIATVDLDWNLTDVNFAFVVALGYSREQLIGSNLSQYLTDEGQVLSDLHRKRKLAGGESESTYEQTFVASGGRHVTFEVSTRLIEEDGRPVGVQGMCRDVTARNEAESKLRRLAELNRYQAHHDSLTGLPNRLHFHDEIEQAIAHGTRKGPFAVVLIDLDHFKEVNDALGHQAGDVLLQELATHLQEIVGARDTVARLGGDEFGVLLHGLSETHGGWAEIVDRIKGAFEQPMLVDGIPVNVEASIGIAVHPTHADSVNALLQRADVAMYVAKTTGRGHAVYSVREDRNDASKLALLGELRRALSERELFLAYQPIVDQKAKGSSKVEALVRWQHPIHGLIPPGDFLPLAERTGLIKPLTLYVLEEAVRQCKQWDNDGHPVMVSVNLSRRNLSEADLVDNVLRILADWDLDPSRLMLEITESATLADPSGTRRVLDRLKESGVKVAVDDFGAGFTSLFQLAHLPLDQIKIDRSFIQGLCEDTHDRAIVRSIIQLSHDLGLEVVAEGVETNELFQELVALECDLFQGFYFSKPLAPGEVVAWLADTAADERMVRAA